MQVGFTKGVALSVVSTNCWTREPAQYILNPKGHDLVSLQIFVLIKKKPEIAELNCQSGYEFYIPTMSSISILFLYSFVYFITATNGVQHSSCVHLPFFSSKVSSNFAY